MAHDQNRASGPSFTPWRNHLHSRKTINSSRTIFVPCHVCQNSFIFILMCVCLYITLHILNARQVQLLFYHRPRCQKVSYCLAASSVRTRVCAALCMCVQMCEAGINVSSMPLRCEAWFAVICITDPQFPGESPQGKFDQLPLTL